MKKILTPNSSLNTFRIARGLFGKRRNQNGRIYTHKHDERKNERADE